LRRLVRDTGGRIGRRLCWGGPPAERRGLGHRLLDVMKDVATDVVLFDPELQTGDDELMLNTEIDVP